MTDTHLGVPTKRADLKCWRNILFLTTFPNTRPTLSSVKICVKVCPDIVQCEGVHKSVRSNLTRADQIASAQEFIVHL